MRCYYLKEKTIQAQSWQSIHTLAQQREENFKKEKEDNTRQR